MEPQSRLGVAALTKMAFSGEDLTSLQTELVSQCLNGSACAATLMDLSIIEQLRGNLEIGLQWQSQALETCRVFRTYQPEKTRKTLLVFAAPTHMGGNTPVEFLLPSDAFEIVTYYPHLHTPTECTPELPKHAIAFCAAPADAEDAQEFFDNVRRLRKNTGIRVLNLPENLVKPERDTLPERLNRVAGLRLPKTTRIDRKSLLQTLEDETEADIFRDIGGYPYVVRPTGSHAGLGLVKIDTRAHLTAYLAERDEENFFVSEFINYASTNDGNFRKYRIVMVGGKAFPCHMAISNRWDVWYMNSNMRASEEKRHEEASFMDQFDAEFGMRHLEAFEALSASLGLDYFGFDCAEDVNGNLVVFEVDNALIVHDMDCEAIFPYKKRHMNIIFSAFEKMLLCNIRAPDQYDATKPLPPTSANSSFRYALA
ncbi:MAG: hypothetical protein ABJ327_18810 [Litoreibacter sp.]